MSSASPNIIGSYLYKIGWQVDKLPDIAKSLNTIKFLQFAQVLAQISSALFEMGKAAAEFSDKVLKADIQTQIFAKRLLTTTQNARSLQSVMGAMGIQSLSELRDVALNPTLRAQFVALRKFTQGLEPGQNVQSGLGNLREVTFQLQKINVLFAYFSQYVVGILGKILEGPLKELTDFLDAFTREWKSNIIPWASQVATFIGYIWQILKTAGDIVYRVFQIMGDWHLGSWLRIIGDLILAMMFLVRDSLKWVQDRFGEKPTKSIIPGQKASLLESIPIQIGHNLPGAKEFRKFLYGTNDKVSDTSQGFLGKIGLSTSSKNPNIQKIIAGAQAVAPDRETAKLIIAQALLESGYGKSSLASKYNNYFGIKGKGSAGSVSLPTNEFYGGRMHRVLGNFRAYKSINDSFKDHLDLLSHSRYKGVMAAASFEDKARAVKAAGYATDPNYSQKLIDTYNHAGITININGYNKDPVTLSQHIKQTVSTRILQSASP